MPATTNHTCNLLTGSCAMAHRNYGVCYYALPVGQQACLVRVGAMLAPWAGVVATPTPAVALKLAAALCKVAYAPTATYASVTSTAKTAVGHK